MQIQNKKIDLSKVSSKCGSKTNIKHKPGEKQKLVATKGGGLLYGFGFHFSINLEG